MERRFEPESNIPLNLGLILPVLSQAMVVHDVTVWFKERYWQKSPGVFIWPHLIRRVKYFELAFARNPGKHCAIDLDGVLHTHNCR